MAMQQQQQMGTLQQHEEATEALQQHEEATEALQHSQEPNGLIQEEMENPAHQEEEMEDEEQWDPQQQETHHHKEMQPQQTQESHKQDQMLQDDPFCSVRGGEEEEEEREWTGAGDVVAAAEQQPQEEMAAAEPQQQPKEQRRAAKQQQGGVRPAEQHEEEEMLVQEEEQLQRGDGGESEEQQQEEGDYVVLCNLKRVRSEGCVLKRQHLVRSSTLPITTAYHIEEVVGVGTWGTVLRVVERCSGLVRAAKKICKESHAKELPRFRQEIALYRQLDHPHIARLYEVFEDHRYIYLVMEYCRGGDLLSWLHRQQDKREKARGQRGKECAQQGKHEEARQQQRQLKERDEEERHSEQEEVEEKGVGGSVEEQPHEGVFSAVAEGTDGSFPAAGCRAAETGYCRDGHRETTGVSAERRPMGMEDNDGVAAAGRRMGEGAADAAEKEDEELLCTERQAARFITQLLSALSYLHQKNIAHRDVKLENLLLIHPFEPEEKEEGQRQELSESAAAVGAQRHKQHAHEGHVGCFSKEGMQWQLQRGEVSNGGAGKFREERRGQGESCLASKQKSEVEKDSTFSKKLLVDSIALVDFGLACRFRPYASGAPATGRRRGAGRRRVAGGGAGGATGVMHSRVGTVYHLSPYMLKGLPYDEVDSDLWATGVVLYMLLSGTPPFQGNTEAEIMHKIQHTAVEFSAPCWRRVSPECRDLICRLLYNPFLSAEQQQRQQQQEPQEQQHVTNCQGEQRQQEGHAEGPQEEQQPEREGRLRCSGGSKKEDAGQRLGRRSGARSRRASSGSVLSCSSSGEESSSCARLQAMKMKAAAQGWHPNIRRRMDAAITLTHPWFAVLNCPLLKPLPSKTIPRSTSSPCCASPTCLSTDASSCTSSNAQATAGCASPPAAFCVAAVAHAAPACAAADAASSATPAALAAAVFPSHAAPPPGDVGVCIPAAAVAALRADGVWRALEGPQYLAPRAAAAAAAGTGTAADACVSCSGGGEKASCALGTDAFVVEENQTSAFSAGAAFFESTASTAAAERALQSSPAAAVKAVARLQGQAAAAASAKGGTMKTQFVGTTQEQTALAAAYEQIKTCGYLGKPQGNKNQCSGESVSCYVASAGRRGGTAAGTRWLQRGSRLLHSKAAAAACATSEQHWQQQQVAAAPLAAAAGSTATQCQGPHGLEAQPLKLLQEQRQHGVGEYSLQKQQRVGLSLHDHRNRGGSGSMQKQQQCVQREEEPVPLRRVVSDVAVARGQQQQHEDKCTCPAAADSCDYRHNSSFAQSSNSSSSSHSISSNYSSTARATNASVKRLFSSCLLGSSAEERSPSTLKSRCRTCSSSQMSSDFACSSSSGSLSLSFWGSSDIDRSSIHSSSSTSHSDNRSSVGGSTAVPVSPLVRSHCCCCTSAAAEGARPEAALLCSRSYRRRIREKHLRFCWSTVCVVPCSRWIAASSVCMWPSHKGSDDCCSSINSTSRSCECETDSKRQRKSCIGSKEYVDTWSACSSHGGSGDVTENGLRCQSSRQCTADPSSRSREVEGCRSVEASENAATGATAGRQQTKEEDCSRMQQRRQKQEIWSISECVLEACQVRNFRCLRCNDSAAAVAESATLLLQHRQPTRLTQQAAVATAAGELHGSAVRAPPRGEEELSAATADTSEASGMLGSAAAAGEVALLCEAEAVREEQVPRKEMDTGSTGPSSNDVPVAAVAAQGQLHAATARPSGAAPTLPLLPVPHVHFDGGDREAFAPAAGVSATATAAAASGPAAAMKWHSPHIPCCFADRSSSIESRGKLVSEKKGDSCPALLQLADAGHRETSARKTHAVAGGAAAQVCPSGIPPVFDASAYLTAFAPDSSEVAAMQASLSTRAAAEKAPRCAAAVRRPATAAAAAPVCPPRDGAFVAPAVARVAIKDEDEKATTAAAPQMSCVSASPPVPPSASATSAFVAASAGVEQKVEPQPPTAALHEKQLHRPCASVYLASESAAASSSAEPWVSHNSSKNSDGGGPSRSSSNNVLLSSSGALGDGSGSIASWGKCVSSTDSSPAKQKGNSSSNSGTVPDCNILLGSSTRSGTNSCVSSVASPAAAAAAVSSFLRPHNAAEAVAAAAVPPPAFSLPAAAGACSTRAPPLGFIAAATTFERRSERQSRTGSQQQCMLLPQQAQQQQGQQQQGQQQQGQQKQQSSSCELLPSATYPSFPPAVPFSPPLPPSLCGPVACSSLSPSSFSSAFGSPSSVLRLSVSSPSPPLSSSRPSPFPSSSCFPADHLVLRLPPSLSPSSSSSSFSSFSLPCPHAAVSPQHLRRKKKQGGGHCCVAAADPAQEAVFRCRTLLLLSATAWSSFAALKTLQRAFRTVVAREMDDEVEVRVLRALFAALDRSQKGVLSLEDLRWGLLLARDFCTAEFYCWAKKNRSSLCHVAAVGGGGAATASDAGDSYNSSVSHSDDAGSPARAAAAAALPRDGAAVPHDAAVAGAVFLRQCPSSSRHASAAVFGSRTGVVQEGAVRCSSWSSSRNNGEFWCQRVLGCTGASCDVAAACGDTENVAAVCEGAAGDSSGSFGCLWETGSRSALHRLAATLSPCSQLPLLLSGALKPGLRSLRRVAALHSAGGDTAPEQLLPYLLNLHALLGLPLPPFVLPFARWLLRRGADETAALQYYSRRSCTKHRSSGSSSATTIVSSRSTSSGNGSNAFNSSRNTSSSSNRSNRLISTGSSNNVGSDSGSSRSKSHTSHEDCSQVACAEDIIIKGEDAAAVQPAVAAAAGREVWGGGVDGAQAAAVERGRRLGERAAVVAAHQITDSRGRAAGGGSTASKESSVIDAGTTEAFVAGLCITAGTIEEGSGGRATGSKKFLRNGHTTEGSTTEAAEESRRVVHVSATKKERRRAADEDGGPAAAAEVVTAGGRGEAAATKDGPVEWGTARTQEETPQSEAAGKRRAARMGESAAGEAAEGREKAAGSGEAAAAARRKEEATAGGKAAGGGDQLLKTGLSELEEQQSSSWLEDVVAGMDTDGSGSIEFVEFLAASLDQWDLLHREEVCRAAFRYFDRDFDGKASYKDVLTTLSLSPAPSAASVSGTAAHAGAAAGVAAGAVAASGAAAAGGQGCGFVAASSQQQLQHNGPPSYLILRHRNAERGLLPFTVVAGGEGARVRSTRGFPVEKRENTEEDAIAAVSPLAGESRRSGHSSVGVGPDAAAYPTTGSLSTAAATGLSLPTAAGCTASKEAVAAAEAEEAGLAEGWECAHTEQGGLLQQQESAASGTALLSSEDEEFLQDLDVVTAENLPLYRSVLAEIKAIDANKDGYITYEEFLHLLR